MAKDLHILLFPWLAFGHLIPFLQLSIALAKAGIRISFISTPRNIQRLPKVPPNLSALINVMELHLPVVDGLPVGGEATVDITMEEIQYLKTAYDLSHQQLKQFIANDKPDWIIQDIIPHWMADIAREFEVPQILFSVFSAVVLGFIGPPKYLTGNGQRKYWPSPESLTSPREWITFPSSVSFRSHEATDFFNGFFVQNSSGVADCERAAITIETCQAVAVRSCSEYEVEYLDLARKVYRKPVIPVGLLLPAPLEKREAGEGEWFTIFKWLDEQKPNTVVFVGFGSECKLSKDHVSEIAHGLELSDLPFLWALRKPLWPVDDVDALPLNFKTRIEGRGVVCMGWAPQLEILGHPSIGGSLFHSGWGSIIETLQFGHIPVVLPLVLDQSLNARFLVEKGLAVEVERSEDGSFDGKGIARALRKAMVDEEGESLRARARDMKTIFGDGRLHQNYIDGFIQYLEEGLQNKAP